MMTLLVLSGLSIMAQSPKDLEKGKEYWGKAQKAYAKKYYYPTFKNNKKSAELGYPRGMMSLAICYGMGIGTQKDYEKAIYWYKKAMEHPEDSWAYPRTCFNLAENYVNGHGVAKDISKAAQLCAQGINNFVEADYGYGYTPESDGFKWWYGFLSEKFSNYIKDYKDFAYVFDFFETKGYGKSTNSFPFKRSFNMRSEFAIEKVKEIVEKGAFEIQGYYTDVEKMKKLAQNMLKEASVSWGVYLYNDKGTPQDKATAIALWEKYSDFGLAQDMLIVAKGDGLYNKNIQKEWYMQEKHTPELYAAADKGNVEAQFTRAIELDLKNNDSRMGWYEKAAAQGYAKAKERIAMLNKEKAEKEKAEKARQEAAAKQEAARKAQDLALKKKSVGKQIYWEETLTYDLSSGGLGSILMGVVGLNKLNEVSYTVRYTAIVERVIAGESVKCIIKQAKIVDPSWVSSNYLKYKKYAQAEIVENVGKTRVLNMNEFNLR